MSPPGRTPATSEAEQPSAQQRNRIHPEPRRRGLYRHARTPGTRVRARAARGGPGALRTGTIRLRHKRDWRFRSARTRAAEGDGATRDHSRRHASLRREPARRARSLHRCDLGEPLELLARSSHTTVSSPTIRFANSFDRGAVIGAVLDAWMLVPGWVRGQTTPAIRRCDARHGGESHRSRLSARGKFTPLDDRIRSRRRIRTRAMSIGRAHDRGSQRAQPRTVGRGYSPQDVENIFSANFLRFLRSNWLS